MTKLQLRAFIFQLICFGIIFILIRILVNKYSSLQGYMVPLLSFVVATILAPKFYATKTKDGEKLFMSWLFIKGVKQIGE